MAYVLENTILFGGAFVTNLYNSPDSFCWDFACKDETVVDNPKSPNYNIDRKVSL